MLLLLEFIKREMILFCYLLEYYKQLKNIIFWEKCKYMFSYNELSINYQKDKFDPDSII